MDKKNVLWIGIWCDHWIYSGNPISIAVHQSNNDWSRKALSAFKETYTDVEGFDGHAVISFSPEGNYDCLRDKLFAAVNVHLTSLGNDRGEPAAES